MASNFHENSGDMTDRKYIDINIAYLKWEYLFYLRERKKITSHFIENNNSPI